MKNKLKTLGMMSILVSGCSAFYGYQPPAPIYGTSQGTNPYEDAIVEPIQPQQRIQTVVSKPLIENKVLPLTVEDKTDYQAPVVVIKKTSPAIIALVAEADRRGRAGDLESAVVTIERALRIDSRNPDLTYRLAKLRLQQSKPRLAEDLAKKAALLSANNRVLKKKSWLLISEARRKQKNYFGAKEAKLKADSL